jgi:hypothetical protein
LIITSTDSIAPPFEMEDTREKRQLYRKIRRYDSFLTARQVARQPARLYKPNGRPAFVLI